MYLYQYHRNPQFKFNQNIQIIQRFNNGSIDFIFFRQTTGRSL